MVLIIDPQVSGLAGNMFIGAFIDLGADKKKITEIIKTYGSYFGKVEVNITKQLKSGITTTYAHIKAEDNNKTRHYRDITEQLDKITEKHYPDNEKIKKTVKLTKKIFKTIALAESRAHSTEIDKIHFHEVGNTDAVCDVLASSYAYYDLGLDREKIYSLPVAVGYGSVKTQHGILPVPAPAVINILENVPTHTGDEKTELTTPTGAAILVNITDEYTTQTPVITNKKTGYGAGKKDLKTLNALRIIKAESITQKETITTLQTNIDTLTGEVLGSLFETLLDEGARDVTITPTIMKKNRPGHIITVICKNRDAEHLTNTLIKHTGTLGVRITPVIHRAALSREKTEQTITINNHEEKINFKIGYTQDNKIIKYTPEYEDLKRISEKTGIPIKDLAETIRQEGNGDDYI